MGNEGHKRQNDKSSDQTVRDISHSIFRLFDHIGREKHQGLVFYIRKPGQKIVYWLLRHLRRPEMSELTFPSTVGQKSHDPCFHKKHIEAGLMTFVPHCTCNPLERMAVLRPKSFVVQWGVARLPGSEQWPSPIEWQVWKICATKALLHGFVSWFTFRLRVYLWKGFAAVASWYQTLLLHRPGKWQGPNSNS